MSQTKKTKSLIVDSSFHRMRLDTFLQKNFSSFSRTSFQRLIKHGHVLVNKKPQNAGYKLKTDDTVTITFENEKILTELQPEKIPLDIIHEDDEIIVINKPTGMVVHPACGNFTGTLVHALLNHFKNLPTRKEENAWLRPGLVHRLDKDTSGIMLIAKTEGALHLLAKQFENRTITKTYLALVHGKLSVKKGMIDASIGRNINDRKKMAIGEGAKLRDAITHFTVLKNFRNELKLIEVKPKTGRTHQIRVHLRYIGCPVVGDPTYGINSINKLYNAHRTMLHAKSISFTHPTLKKQMSFSTELSEDFLEIMEMSLNK